jgi:hypothetical protein
LHEGDGVRPRRPVFEHDRIDYLRNDLKPNGPLVERKQDSYKSRPDRARSPGPRTSFKSSSRTEREHIRTQPGIAGGQCQQVLPSRRSGHQADHTRSIEARHSICADVSSARVTHRISIDQHRDSGVAG